MCGVINKLLTTVNLSKPICCIISAAVMRAVTDHEECIIFHIAAVHGVGESWSDIVNLILVSVYSRLRL